MSIRLGNGNWAVSSSKLLAYNDAAGPFFNKEFDFTRNSSATRYNKSSLIEFFWIMPSKLLWVNFLLLISSKIFLLNSYFLYFIYLNEYQFNIY